ncbi:MAG: hypothetical protein Q4A65_04270 [Bacillota bacterium]|nr:hypothetical protein [Bacillota bacterium]
MRKMTMRIFLLAAMLIFVLMGASSVRHASAPAELLHMDAASREAAINEWLPHKELLLKPFRITGKAIDKRYFPEMQTLTCDDGQMLKGSLPTDPAFAADRTQELYRACEKQGVNFLYVIVPGKPLFDEDLTSMGIPCSRNNSAARGRKALEERGIPVLDLREKFRNEYGPDCDRSSLYYKTDHHWNTDAVLKAAGMIAGDLNERFGQDLPAGNLDEDKFGREVYRDAFVGEMGMKALGEYGGRDDFIRRYPLYDTNIRLVSPARNSDETGDFGVMTNDAVLEELPVDTGDSLYYYYMYGNYCHDEIFNKNVPEGDILLIKDSFGNAVSPFLAMACRHLTLWDMRTDTDVTSWIKEHPEIETVIVVYNTAYVTDSEMNDYH